MVSSEQEFALEFKQVFQSYRLGFLMNRVEILKDVSFEVPKNKIFGFLGSNGAGKTTLIKLVVGLHKPTRGQVLLNGVPTFYLESKINIGYMPERPYFHDHLTGEGLLYYSGTLSGMTQKSIAQRIPEVLALVAMSHAAKTELKRYSKGMLQRIGIAQAILHDPELLVLDEPMSGLDPMGRREIRDLIKRLHSTGKTIFFSTHIIQDVEEICHEIALIDKGKIVGRGTAKEYLEKDQDRCEIVIRGEVGGDMKDRFEKIEEVPEGHKLHLYGEKKTQETLQALMSSGYEVIAVSPVRTSIEKLYTRVDHS